MKNYSSGMTVRLAFAIAANLDPDMLLLDEVFAVGDEAFQQQCIRTVQQFRADGKTILFVSHSAAAIRSICDRVCLLDRGRLLFDGAVSRGLEEYDRVTASRAWRCDRRSPARRRRREAGIGSCRADSGSRQANGRFSCCRREGLQPADSVLDVGCGSLSTGRHLLQFLDPGRYWGFDVNQALILAGVTMELPRLGVSPIAASICSIRNSISQRSQRFRFAISEGFFSRLSVEPDCAVHCRGHAATRSRTAASMRPGSRIRIRGVSSPIDRDGFTTFPDAEPYHYPFEMLASICNAVGANAQRVNPPYPHPRGESLMLITRRDDD